MAKVLLGMNPAGAMTFTSLPFPGKITDVDITNESLNDGGTDINGTQELSSHRFSVCSPLLFEERCVYSTKRFQVTGFPCAHRYCLRKDVYTPFYFFKFTTSMSSL